MPSTITSLTTSGKPGDTFTLIGTGFGAADPNSKVYVVADANGEILVTPITSWTNLQIVGVLPNSLAQGSEVYLVVLLVDESSGTHSPFFTVGQPYVTQVASYQFGVYVQKKDAFAKDTSGSYISDNQYGLAAGYIDTYYAPNEYDIKFQDDIFVAGGSTFTKRLSDQNFVKTGGLSVAIQANYGMGFYQNAPAPR